MFNRNKRNTIGKKHYVIDPHGHAVWEYPATGVDEALRYLNSTTPGCFLAEAWSLGDLVRWHQEVFKGFKDILFESHDRGYEVHHLSRAGDGTVSLLHKCCRQSA